MIQLDRKRFSRALGLANAAIERRNCIPALGGVRATANEAFVLEGSDLDNSTRVEMSYTGDHAAFTLTGAEGIRSAINLAGSDMVALSPEEDGRHVGIKSGRLSGELCTLAADDHPGADHIANEDFFADISGVELGQIARVTAAISTKQTRYYLNGICVRKIGEWLYRFAATDGHRLMMVDVPLPNAKGAIPDDTIIPRRWLGIALAQFSKAKTGVRLSYGPSIIPNSKGEDLAMEKKGSPRIRLSAEIEGMSFQLTGKLIDGTYPDYSRVIPANNDKVARMKRADLMQAIKSLSPLSTERTPAVKLIFGPGLVVIELDSPEVGKTWFEVPCEGNTPNGFWIRFNGRYLLEMLAALRGDEVELHLDDAGSPTLVVDPSDTAFRGVLMPMRV